MRSSTRTSRRRLDEILIEQGAITEAQVAEALMRQKAHGGKFGSQILYHRHIDEETLVRALSVQFSCEGVVLEGRTIPANVIAMIPAKICVGRRVLPFAYHDGAGILKVACEDPSNPHLARELSFATGGKKIALCVAAELALAAAIGRHVLGQETTLDQKLLAEVPDVLHLEESTINSETGTVRQDPDAISSVLLVTDEVYAAPLVRSLLEQDGYQVTTAVTADAALIELEEHPFDAVFIRSSISGDYLHVVDRARRLSPRTVIRFFDKASGLIMGQNAWSAEADLVLANCDLFTSLLSTKAELRSNRGGRVGRYADKLCKQLRLPDRDRIMITNAAFLHDLARYYYRVDDLGERRELIQLTVRLLKSLNYSPVILEMLRAAYTDLNETHARRLPIERLGGNVVTIADMFCNNFPVGEPISIDRVAAFKERLRKITGKVLLAEVVEAFIEVIQHDMLAKPSTGAALQVMVFEADKGTNTAIMSRLKNEGFRVVRCTHTKDCVQRIKRKTPDILLLNVPSKVTAVSKILDELSSDGVDFTSIPTILVTEATDTAGLTELLGSGVEDVVAAGESLDFLINKLHKLTVRLKRSRDRSRERETTEGARGRLADMSLIDLLQALGSSRKTVKISVRSNDKEQGKLRLYLNNGVITFALCGKTTGAEAVYDGLTWTDGHWSVEPIEESALPEPNNHLSNESILMEGCRLLDEKVRAGQLL